ncbi:Sporulation-control protein spo0M [compost metagenome]
MLYPDEQGVELLLQIDRKARGLSGLLAEALDADEKFVRLRFDQSHLAAGTEYIAGQLLATISKYA